MSVESSRTRLVMLTRTLNVRWQETRHQWQDARGRHFEQAYIEPLLNNVESAAEAMHKLGEVLQQIRRDCAPTN